MWMPQKLEVARSMCAGMEHDIATIARVMNASRASIYGALSADRQQTAWRRPLRTTDRPFLVTYVKSAHRRQAIVGGEG